MKVKDLKEGVNVFDGYNLSNKDDSYMVVHSFNTSVLEQWINKHKLIGEEEVVIKGKNVTLPSFEESRVRYINGKAIMLESFKTTQ